MVRIDVGDQHVVEIALVRLFAGVREQTAGIELFDRNTATAVSEKVHGGLRGKRKPRHTKTPRRTGSVRHQFGAFCAKAQHYTAKSPMATAFPTK
jgi:hypothetical protein